MLITFAVIRPLKVTAILTAALLFVAVEENSLHWLVTAVAVGML
jgi:hypothetical protein